MKTIGINLEYARNFADATELKKMHNLSAEAMKTVDEGTGAGNDFLGWVNLPAEIDCAMLDDIKQTAAKLRAETDYVVCIGIGGSYLGAKAIIDALSDAFASFKQTEGPKVLFAGQNIGEDYMAELQQLLQGKRFGIIVISKSGTTTEPAIAFRLLKEQLETQAGKAKASELIVAITDARKGALRTLANTEGYKTFVIADNVGGRFSVLTPVGLLPVAVAGFDIAQFVAGAHEMQQKLKQSDDDNIARLYASMRNTLYQSGRKIEILVNYHPKLHYIAEWWKQLYGESEGKEGKGIFPASVDLTTDLHSMGQWMQDGERTIFETVLSVENQHNRVCIPADSDNLDGLNYLAGKRIDEVNRQAEIGTRIAHNEGGVPVIRITLPEINEYHLGELIYFFEKGCGISGYMLGVNPFNQPGVEAYKKNMFALLGKPGYEEASKEIQSKI